MGGKQSVPEVDLHNKVAIVTGGNAGIGYETAKGIAVMGAHTIIACRSKDKATAAVEQMKQEIAREHSEDLAVTIEYMILDLASFRSTKDFVVAFKERNLPLHILINNAGLMLPNRIITDDGYESTFQINHLSHLLLTLELLPIILDTASGCGDCRIINVSSTGHKRAEFTPDNMNGEQGYGELDFYCKSKLYNVMFSYSLQQRVANEGITVSSLCPGAVRTNFGTNSSLKFRVMITMLRPIMKTSARGAMTSINCAVNPQLNSQQHFYYSDMAVTNSSPASQNEASQEQLWEISINAVKDWLSPEILAKYGATGRPLEEQPTTGEQPTATEEQPTATEEQPTAT